MFYLFMFLFLAGQSEEIKVGIFHKERITHLNFKVERGIYEVYADGMLIKTLTKNDIINIKPGKKVMIKTSDSLYFASYINIKGRDYINSFKVAKLKNNYIEYDDNLLVKMLNGRLFLRNEVEIDNYVAAVVEGEAGYNLPSEYYKLQAILSRTYVLKNKLKHSDEGFAVCDKVHCQVYHKKCSKDEIIKATYATNSLVAIDSDLKLINTIFHANCGGQTCNSEDVWGQEISYLRCVKDSFCTNERSAVWRKSVSKKKLNNYFANKGGTQGIYHSHQRPNRAKNRKINSVPITKIRTDFKLKSTYFTIVEKGDSAIFYGRGYGHGVGLCQQGGMNMARLGYSYVDILNHYYQGINIVNRNALVFFKE